MAPSPVTVMVVDTSDAAATDDNTVAAPDVNAVVASDVNYEGPEDDDDDDNDDDDDEEETCADRAVLLLMATYFRVLPPLLGAGLMIASQVYSWRLLLGMWPADRPFGWLMPVCFFYWIWACKNRIFGPIRADAGVLTFLPGYIAGGVSFVLPVGRPSFVFTAFAFASTLFPAAQLLMHVAKLHEERAAFSIAKLKARYSDEPFVKPTYWVIAFFAYVHASTAFWLVAGVVGGVRSHASVTAMFVGLGLFLALAPLLKMAVDKLNEGRIEHEASHEGSVFLV